MKSLIRTILLLSMSFHVSAADYVIAVKDCVLKRNYVSSPIKTNSLKKAIHFNSIEEAESYLKKLSPSLKKRKPRIIELIK